MQPAIIPFQIVVGARSVGGLSLKAVAAGRTAEAAFELPTLPDEREALSLALGQTLFPAPLRQLLLDVARGADEAGARVQIQLQVQPPELAALPWEWAALGPEGAWRPALREDYALVRVGRGARSVPTLSVAGPLRLLVVCAPGADSAAAALGHALAHEVRAERLVVDLLRDADPLAVRAALAEEPCHVLHLVAPAAYGQPAGAPADGAPRLRLGRSLDGAGLAGLLDDQPGLRLITLADGAGGDPWALAALASALHETSGLATLALGGINEQQAAAFCGACYAALAAGDSADLAGVDGRATLEAAGGPWGRARLCIAPGGEQLFQLRPASASDPHSQAAYASSSGTPGVRQRLDPDDEQAAPVSAPLGVPLRPQRAVGAALRGALAPLASFAVQATKVGAPARRARPDETQSNWLRPRLLLLLLACLVLALMVSRVLPSAATADELPRATATSGALVGP